MPAVVGVLAFAFAAATAQGAVKRFQPIASAPIPQERLFDIGAVDYDRDGRLDLFTSNHKFHPVLLHNRGDGTFEDVTGPAGLSPSPQFPGYENLRAPGFDRTGVYIYATDPKGEKMPGLLHVRTVGVSAQLSMAFGADSATLQSLEGGTDAQGRTANGQPLISLTLDPGGTAVIQASHIDLPVNVDFSGETIPGLLPILPPTEGPIPPIYIGTNAVSAPSEFVLQLRDRHGYAWADLEGDPGVDAFITAGGLGGAIKLPGYKGKVLDELLVQGAGGTFTDSAAGSGLDKQGCRGRQASVVDADGDGRLDLFATCADEAPALYLQKSPGRFQLTEPPRTAGITYRWAELGGPRPSLLSAEARGTRVLQLNRAGKWRSKQLIPLEARKNEVAQYALGDYDADGDLDVLAVSRRGNALLENRRGRLISKSPVKAGLPGKSVAASFVDYDNNGKLDLDLVPQGLHRGNGNGRFSGTGMLRDKGNPGAGTTIWPDLDNDGLRDPIRLTANAEFARRKRVSQTRNEGPGGHWLEVDLRGKAGNREAIGAMVKVEAGGRSIYQWVGQNDDSHYSQGHYRLYFGLGARTQASNVVVKWPDGSKTQLGTFVADRVIEIAQGG